MDNKEAEHLLEKYLAHNCTPEELLLIKKAYNKLVPYDISEIPEQRYDEMRTNMWNKLGQSPKLDIKTYRLWPKIAVSATLLLTTGAWLHLFVLRKEVVDKKSVSVYSNDVSAGTNKAILTLANGKKISLSDAKAGIVIKTSELSYNDGTVIESIDSKESRSSMITTPRGGQYRIQLPDGTQVALNSASTLKFPASFSGQVIRRVELVGEGYFNVTKDKKHPFIVKSGNQEVKVLGTQFNISCYPDESSMKTTLVEGSVQIKGLSGHVGMKMLSPGQQAEMIRDNISITKVDTESVLAWKNGDFIFNEDIRTIMRQISRWYDVEIFYQGNISEKEYIGTFSRSKNLIDILKALELTKGVHFKVEGRRITVMP
ncbi:FecR family protein [Pedobacter sp. MC2016-24]|uniref:FecR family protein n=1 Tax=Pedobacter sp. MC2016-24 TaxID=2780090 RepID=UPI00187E82BF|nr:FecR family protein [Pedobacter sp. MC2016-24]MBE9599857.1 DUF4974 domain-containing protein [Pedobacter sp. MC2016-24]